MDLGWFAYHFDLINGGHYVLVVIFYVRLVYMHLRLVHVLLGADFENHISILSIPCIQELILLRSDQ